MLIVKASQFQHTAALATKMSRSRLDRMREDARLTLAQLDLVVKMVIDRPVNSWTELGEGENRRVAKYIQDNGAMLGRKFRNERV